MREVKGKIERYFTIQKKKNSPVTYRKRATII